MAKSKHPVGGSTPTVTAASTGIRFVDASDTSRFVVAAERYVAANTSTQQAARSTVDRVAKVKAPSKSTK
jgi:hypothetical protein